MRTNAGAKGVQTGDKWPVSHYGAVTGCIIPAVDLMGPSHLSRSTFARPHAGSPPKWLPDRTDSDDTHNERGRVLHELIVFPNKNALFPDNRFSTHFFSMKMAKF